MTFEQLETSVRDLVSLNKLEEAIHVLQEYFADDEELDGITLQSANYHAIKENQIKGLADNLEVELALNKLRSNVLQLLRSKKEYQKYKEQTFGNKLSDSSSDTEKVKVFFSVGSPFNDDQQQYINKLVTYFDQNGIALETLKGWDDNDPLVPIIQEMKHSNGCLVLALERYFVSDGTEKRGSEQEGKIVGKSYTSPWLHIETALARSLDLPLIILKDQSLKNEGLIHDDKQEWGIVRIDQSKIEQIEEYPVKNFILSWIKQVKKFQENK
ncbi:MAG: hypothetical protein R3A50_03275 [Saprospiraceae bacterium]|nr:hypothetical protein [Saprospiraceae bacterium]MCB9343790.1 hypothetical protein [Lewinellaceae bacterium]